jgi:hypothetical protein
MTTTKAEFQDLAQELMQDEFSDFASPCVLTKVSGFNYATQTYTSSAQTVNAIRMEYASSQVDNNFILTGDFMLLIEYQLVTIGIRPDNTTCTFGGEPLNIISTTIDAADAIIKLQVRKA